MKISNVKEAIAEIDLLKEILHRLETEMRAKIDKSDDKIIGLTSADLYTLSNLIKSRTDEILGYQIKKSKEKLK